MNIKTRAIAWLKAYLRVPATVIVWFIETYGANRARLRDFMEGDGVKKVLSWALVVTVGAWVAIGLLADDRHGARFDCAVEKLVDNKLNEIECRNPAG